MNAWIESLPGERKERNRKEIIGINIVPIPIDLWIPGWLLNKFRSF